MGTGGGDCPEATTFTITGSNTRADNGGTPGWFELAEIKLFDRSGTNVALEASYALLLTPSNPDAIDVLTDGEIFDWSSGQFLVWQSSHGFHGHDLVHVTFDSPKVIVGAELYSTNYESFGTDCTVSSAETGALPLRIVFDAHPNQVRKQILKVYAGCLLSLHNGGLGRRSRALLRGWCRV